MTDNPFFVDPSSPWFSREAGWPDQVPKNYEFPELTLGEMLRQSAKKWPDNIALWFMETEITYARLDALVDRLAASLDKMGIGKGDVVALLLPNSIQYVMAYFATARIGAIVTGCNPLFKPSEILYQLKLTKAKTLIALDIFYAPLIEPIIDGCQVEHVIISNISDMLDISPVKKTIGKWIKKIPAQHVAKSGVYQLKKLLKTKRQPPVVDIDPQDIAAYLMTGGTTGVPKAAILSHFNIVSNAIQCNLWLWKCKEETGCLGVLPLFHSFAMTCAMNAPLLMGWKVLLFPKPPAPQNLFDIIDRVTPPNGMFYPAAEAFFKSMAEWPGVKNYDLKDKIVAAVSGAGPLHRNVQLSFENITGARLVEGYGLTEASPVVSAGPFWGERDIGNIGLPFTGTQWKIVDINNPNKLISIGEPGEIAIAGPQVMIGYLSDPDDAQEEVIIQDGSKRWLLTGDIGMMDRFGRITIVDRKKQLIKYKGWSVYPTEIETILLGHEAIKEAAVGGLPDPECNEIIKAWIVLNDGYEDLIEPEDILIWAQDNLTFYKVPQMVQFVSELPKTFVGKIQRRSLQESDPIWKEFYSQFQQK